MKALLEWWRAQPAVRFVVRATVVGGLAYMLTAIKNGDPLVLNNLMWAAILGGGYALLGLLTPVEPLVGVKARVKVPSPPAQPERHAS